MLILCTLLSIMDERREIESLSLFPIDHFLLQEMRCGPKLLYTMDMTNTVRVVTGERSLPMLNSSKNIPWHTWHVKLGQITGRTLTGKRNTEKDRLS